MMSTTNKIEQSIQLTSAKLFGNDAKTRPMQYPTCRKCANAKQQSTWFRLARISLLIQVVVTQWRV